MLLAAMVLLPQLASGPVVDAVKLPAPGVEYRTNIASATRKPWVNANGWRLDREAGRKFYYDVAGPAAALAAAESFSHHREAFVHTDEAGTQDFGKMLTFLKSVGAGPMNVLPDFGAIDDGSAASGEVLNLLARLNYQIRFLPGGGAKLPRSVDPTGQLPRIYPFLQEVRNQVGDKNRVVRLFGTEVVLARAEGEPGRMRVHLINYGSKPVISMQVHVAGHFERGTGMDSKSQAVALGDFDVSKDATEFTVPALGVYAVIDLFAK